jgi:hypothetical protein
VRVYVPTTLNALPGLLADRIHPGGRACAVTPALREWYASGDEDELEYVALNRAARLSLELLADEVTAPRRRVVLAADVSDDQLGPATGNELDPLSDPDPAEVLIRDVLPIGRISAVHVDDVEAVPLVRAVLVDPGDEMALGNLEDLDLLWYATQEIDQLV